MTVLVFVSMFVIIMFGCALAIALQCPAAGGQAVYRARAMLASINDSLVYNDAAACLLVGIYKDQPMADTTPAMHFTLMPNPANYEVTILFHDLYEGNCHIKITNALGQVKIVQTAGTSQLQHSVDISKLRPGVYFVELEGNITSRSQKLIVIR